MKTITIIIVLIACFCGFSQKKYSNVTSKELRYEVYQLNEYQVVQINNQNWMLENLNVQTFQNGDSIPHAKSKNQWDKSNENGTPAWCYYSGDSINGKTYGKLYNWYALNDPRGLAPNGWRLATFSDFEKLQEFLGHNSGLKMKFKYFWAEYGCKKCNGVNSKKCVVCKGKIENSQMPFDGNGNNFSGFSALPGGSRFATGEFDAWSEHSQLGRFGYWWCTDEQSNKLAKYVKLQNNSNLLDVYGVKEKGTGMSVRCILE